MKLAVGLIETKGLVGAIEAADAMVKAADVKIVNKERSSGALITIKITGEVAAVKSAIDAGSAAAQRVGQLVSTHVIPRPHEDIDSIINETDKIVVPQSRPKSKADSKIDKTIPGEIKREQARTVVSPAPQKQEKSHDKPIPGDEVKGAPTAVPPKQAKPTEKPTGGEQGKKAPPADPPKPVKPPEKPAAREEVKGEPPSGTPKAEKPAVRDEVKSTAPAAAPKPVKPPQEEVVEDDVKSVPPVDPPKSAKPKEKSAEKEVPKTPPEPETKEKIEKKVPQVKKGDADDLKGQDHLMRLREEAKKELKSSGEPVSESTDNGSDVKIPPVEELEKMNVHQLRRLARSIPSLPIKGREISIANRGTLLDFLKKL